MSIRLFVVLTAAAICVAGCSKKNEAEEAREAAAKAEAQLPSGPATMETVDAAPGTTSAATSLPSADTAASSPATMSNVSAEFDVNAVPLSTASLPPFPFFKDPEGQENFLKGSDALKPFDRHYFIAGNKLVAQEGKLAFKEKRSPRFTGK